MIGTASIPCSICLLANVKFLFLVQQYNLQAVIGAIKSIAFKINDEAMSPIWKNRKAALKGHSVSNYLPNFPEVFRDVVY